MKKTLILSSLVILLGLNGCKKDDTVSAEVKPDPIEEQIISAIFSVGASGMSGVRASQVTQTKDQFKVGSSTPINQTLNSTTNGVNGGSVTVTGNLSGTSDSNGGGTFTINMNEKFNNYGLVAEAKNYVAEGNIVYAGNITTNMIQSGSVAAGNLTYTQTGTSKINVSGSLNVTGPNYNKSTSIQLSETEAISATEITITISGTIGGKNLNYSQTIKE